MKKWMYVIVIVFIAQFYIAGAICWNVFGYAECNWAEDPNVNRVLRSAFPGREEGTAISVHVYLGENNFISHAILTPSTEFYALAWGGPWRQFNEGDMVDYTAIFGDHNDYWFYIGNKVYTDRSLIIPRGESVYLGFGLEYPGIYGWVQLGYDGNSVYVINSAVDIDGDPIQVGWIPEPSAGILALAACAVLLLRRGRMGCERRVRHNATALCSHLSAK